MYSEMHAQFLLWYVIYDHFDKFHFTRQYGIQKYAVICYFYMALGFVDTNTTIVS